MKNLSTSQIENLVGGLCALNEQTGECLPSVCTGLGIALEASGDLGIGIPLVACIA